MLKTFFVNALKFIVAGGLIYWLVSSGKLDFKLLGQLRNHASNVLGAALLVILNYILISFRWETILRSRSQATIPIWGLVKVTWIGQFFSSVLPGSVSGDLVKILYIQRFDESFSKKFIFASILIDRVMGLCALIILVGCTSIFFGKTILTAEPEVMTLLNVNFLLMVVVIVGMGVFFFCHRFVRNVLLRLQSIFFKRVFEKVIFLWDDLVLIKTHMLKAVGISLVVQFSGVFSFWLLINPFVGDLMKFVEAMAFIPLGLMTLALPIAPSGLGVGHAIFQKLFEFFGITNGASLFNLYFVVTLVVNLFGAIPYILTRVREPKL